MAKDPKIWNYMYIEYLDLSYAFENLTWALGTVNVREKASQN